MMHELGHTMGLAHSGEGTDKYGDRTSNMAKSSRSETTPQRCFDGRNNHVLGWYDDRELVIDPLKTRRSTVTLAGFVDYATTPNNEKVLITLKDDSVDYGRTTAGKIFVQYNRATDHHIGTGEKRMQVTVYDDTTVVGALAIGGGATESHTFSNYRGSGENLVIRVCSEVDSSDNFSYGPDAFVVSVGMGSASCPVQSAEKETPSPTVPIPQEAAEKETAFPTARQTAAPTTAPTKAPSAAPTEDPAAQEAQEKQTSWFSLYDRLHGLGNSP